MKKKTPAERRQIRVGTWLEYAAPIKRYRVTHICKPRLDGSQWVWLETAKGETECMDISLLRKPRRKGAKRNG